MASNITMTPKLKDITTSYHSFQNDQVLTAPQLNEFLNYFEDQDRLSRIRLSGVGIVCGFKVSLIQEKQFLPIDAELVTSAEKKLFNSKVTKIVIEQGAGVTTDGDLLYLRENSENKPLKKIKAGPETYTNYKIYDDHRSGYTQFIRDGKQIPLWELIPGSDVTSETTDPVLSAFPDLDKMVVLLYLECYEDEPNLCDGLSCDNQGREQVARLRALLVSQPDADYILSSDMIFNKHDLMATYLKMKDLSVKRVVANSVNSASLNNLKASFELTNEGQLITDMKDGLTLMRNKIHPYYQDHPIDSILTALNAKLPAATPSQVLYFQYRYDLLRDIVDSYNEAKELFIEVATECCPSITAFPKHLMLGKLSPTEEDSLVKRYTHHFYKAPILVDESREFEPFMWTLFRMLHQLNAYPALPETNTGGLYRNDIKITPSNYRTELGKKAIPFYYNLNSSLLRAWNREKTLKGKYKLNLSYNTGLLDTSPAIQTPLRYNLEGTNFLRIEGHQGRDYKEVMAKIDQIKKDNGLSFDLKAISIDLDSSIVIDTTNYECEFEDLAVLLTAWVQEQECMIAKVISLVSAFSVKEPGKNIKDAQYLPKEIVLPSKDATEVMGKSRVPEPSTVSAPIAAVVSTPDQRKAQANNQQEYGRSNTVIDNLTPTEFTVGHSYLQAVLQNPKGTPAEFIAGANVFANDVVIEHQVVWQADQYTALVKNSIQIMSYAHVLSNSIPLTIAGITDLVISRYNTNINNLCSVLNKIQVSQANVENLSNTNRAILELLIAQLSQICCAAKQLQTLLVEIDRRKDAILEKLTLKKFVEDHPGMEHLGGVEQGGTFVLVYLRKGATVNTTPTAPSTTVETASTVSSGVFAEETVSNPRKKTLGEEIASKDTSEAKSKRTILTSDAGKQTVTEAKTSSSTMTPTERAVADTRAVAVNTSQAAIIQNLFTSAPNGTVVADFTLPYMCCSDCSPINFIMPAPIVKLSLPVDTLCLKGTAPITLTFNVEPASGEIKADPQLAGMTITGKQLTIDPRTFPTASLDTVINFTVNNQITNCKLTVVKPLTAAISAPSNPVTNPIVNFLAIGNFPAGTLYNWDFGDGQSSSLRNVTHTYTLPVNSANSLDVTLTVSPANGACPTIVTRNLVFEGVQISLEQTEFCFNDENPYKFTITPAGATADISGSGVDSIANTFTPADAFEGEVPIYLNGEEAFTVTVNPDPTAVVTGRFTEQGLELKGTVSNEEEYKWTFVDGDNKDVFDAVGDTLTPIITTEQMAKVPAGTEFYAVLTVRNKCAEKLVRKQFFTPQTDDNCPINAKEKVLDKYQDLLDFIEKNPLFDKLTKAQKALFIDVKNYMSPIVNDPSGHISGEKNSEILEVIGSFELKIYEEIKKTPARDFPDQLKALTGLYRYIMEKFLAFIQCQDEGLMKRFTALFEQYDPHLNPENQSSFKAMGVIIDDEDELLTAIQETLDYRPDGSASWKYIEQYRVYLMAQRQKSGKE